MTKQYQINSQRTSSSVFNRVENDTSCKCTSMDQSYCPTYGMLGKLYNEGLLTEYTIPKKSRPINTVIMPSDRFFGI